MSANSTTDYTLMINLAKSIQKISVVKAISDEGSSTKLALS